MPPCEGIDFQCTYLAGNLLGQGGFSSPLLEIMIKGLKLLVKVVQLFCGGVQEDAEGTVL